MFLVSPASQAGKKTWLFIPNSIGLFIVNCFSVALNCMPFLEIRAECNCATCTMYQFKVLDDRVDDSIMLMYDHGVFCLLQSG